MQKILASLTVILTIITLPLTLISSPKPAIAAYSANNLISDAEFTNWSVLDASGVQSFLNTRTGTRLRTFSENGRSAAQIIADAARANGISPYVILATIQKEESLVDSNYNFDYRVNWAMGYAICDSCSLDDPNVVKYKGFTKQIDNATWQLKYNYSLWATNGSAWNVGRTMNIDGTSVRFANRATSSLYRYTPHLHGNQNFYNIYSNFKTFYYKAGTVKSKGTTTKSVVGKTLTSVKSKLTGAKGGQTNSQATYDAGYVTQSGPQTLTRGQKSTIYVYLKNTGTATWTKTGNNPIRIGNSGPRDRASSFTGGNTRWQMLSATVPPGRTGVFSIQITAPSQSGSYTEKFQALAENAAWFGPEVAFTFTVR